MEFIYFLPNLYSAIHLNYIQYCKVEKGWTVTEHRHPYFEFLYCASGEIEQWVNGRPYHLKSGDAMIIKPSLYHHTSRVTDGTIFFDFHFDLEVKEVFNLFAMIVEPMLQVEEAEKPKHAMINWIEEFIDDFGEDMHQIVRNNEVKNMEDLFTNIQSTVRLLQMHSRVLEFISLLANIILSSKAKELKLVKNIHLPGIKVAHDVAYLLEANVTSSIQVNEIANRLKLHRSYLSLCFKKVYGISPSTYLTRIRIREAKQLLQKTDWSIENIADHLNFSSAGHFSRTFKSIMDLSPIHYRNHMKKQH